MSFKEYPSVTKLYDIADNYTICVDQSTGRDKTVLAFIRHKNNKIQLQRFQEIEKQEDMDKYINLNRDKLINMFEEEE